MVDREALVDRIYAAAGGPELWPSVGAPIHLCINRLSHATLENYDLKVFG
jgi:hypothetical protein